MFLNYNIIGNNMYYKNIDKKLTAIRELDVEKTYIIENENFKLPIEIFEILLIDRTISNDKKKSNIFWATSDYEYLGKGYRYNDKIQIENITNENIFIITPRILKNKTTQASRIRGMAEVFTPSWICNQQNNMIDELWFGRKNIFNYEYTKDDGTREWYTNFNKIIFPNNKSWTDYVHEKRLEITCGEAPYTISRYDVTTGKSIPIYDRIGLLDRKLRIINENTDDHDIWCLESKKAFQSIYAYEWQGDSLFIARKSLLYTFIEYYYEKFKKTPSISLIKDIAYIISWNVWQMDGTKGVIPNTCHNSTRIEKDLFGNEKITSLKCDGCKTGNIKNHNGKYSYIIDWDNNKIIRYIDLITF